MSQQQRTAQLEHWLQSLPGYSFTGIRPASADASFRRYFRATDNLLGNSYIIMDAPPDKEPCSAFIYITQLLRDAGVNAPELVEQDQEQGFLLLADLGDTLYLEQLCDDSADSLYSDAILALLKMQSIDKDLPEYNEARLTAEMDLFEPWYVNTRLGVELNAQQKRVLEQIYQLLVDNAQQQPQVFVHRDYHSRNLMLTEYNNPGVLDYQDAVIGPITYDLVSLLKDCYIEWPRAKVEHWLDEYLAQTDKIKVGRAQFIKWFDLMGVQRHLKVLGIFARLHYRDGKAQYLEDLPLVLKYVVDTCEHYDELRPLEKLLQDVVMETAQT